jgi:PIN domain nuclease of toxin-antitoxin system
MPRYFVDSSALAKIYHVETGTSKMLAILAEPGGEFFISSLTVIEIQSVPTSILSRLRAWKRSLS